MEKHIENVMELKSVDVCRDIQDLGFRVWDLGRRVLGLGFRAQGLGFGIALVAVGCGGMETVGEYAGVHL